MTKESKRTRVINSNSDKEYDIYIGRPSKWGNPYKITKNQTREQAIEKYRWWIMRQPNLLRDLYELKGKTLACFCKPLACHGDVLVELVERLPQ